MGTIQVTVNDADRSIHYLDTSLSIGLRTNDVGRASCNFRSRLAAAQLGYDVPDYRPAEGDQIAFFWDGVRFFVGEITNVKTKIVAPYWVGGTKQLFPVMHTLSIASLEVAIAQRYIGVTDSVFNGRVWTGTDDVPLFSGTIVNDILTDIDDPRIFVGTVQNGQGLTSYASGINGPENAWAAIKGLADLNGYVAYVDGEGGFNFVPRGFVSADWSISPEGVTYKRIEYTTQRQSDYHNRELRRIPYKSYDPTVEAFAGDGTTTDFTLANRVGRIESIIVSANNGQDKAEQTFGVLDVNTNDIAWAYVPGSVTVSSTDKTTPLQTSETVEITYRPLGSDVIVVTSADAEAANGNRLVEAYYDDSGATGVSLDDEMNACNLSITRASVMLETVEVETTTHNEPAILTTVPGQQVSVQNDDVGVDTTCYVDSVDIRDLSTVLQFTIGLVGKSGTDATDSATRKSGAAMLASAGGGGIGSGGSGGGGVAQASAARARPQEIDKGSVSDPPAEWTVFGVGVGSSVAVANDVTLHRSVYSAGNPFECIVTSKTPGAFTIDIQRSSDNAATWATIFADKPVVPADTAAHVFTSFVDGIIFNRGDQLRIDVTGSDGAASDVHVLLRWRRITSTAGSSDGGTDASNLAVPLM